MSTQTITEFLEARIAEDEREANVCLDQYRRGEGGTRSRWMRQLAECGAKRAIVETQSVPKIAAVPNPFILRALATVYSDHPDYQQEWAL